MAPERGPVPAFPTLLQAGSHLAGSKMRAWRRAQVKGEVMRSFLQIFWKDESGQDLIEYTLLMAFVALASASLFISAGTSVSGIWGTASNQLSSANAQSS